MSISNNILRLFGSFLIMVSGSFIVKGEESTSGLVGMQETVIANGKSAPNGYLFYTNDPDNYRGIVSYAHSSDGILGIRGSKDNDNYASWEVVPEVKLPAGNTYRISAGIKHSQLSDKQHIGIEIYSFDAAGNPKRLIHVLHNNSIIDQWHTIGGEFTVPEDSARLRVRIDLTSPGEMFFRDLRITSQQDSAQTAARLYQPGNFDFIQGYVSDTNGLPAAELPQEMRYYDGNTLHTIPHCSVAEDSGKAIFTLNGETGVNRSMRWIKKLDSAVDLSQMQFFSIRYRITNVLRAIPVAAVVQLRGYDEKNNAVKVDMLTSSIAFDDGAFHTVSGKLPDNFCLSEISVQLKTNSSGSVLEIADIAFYKQLPQSDCSAAEYPADFVSVDLNRFFNVSAADVYAENLAKYTFMVDRVLQFTPEKNIVKLENIPFKLSDQPLNLVKPPFDNSKNAETFPFLGETGTRKNISPVSREDVIEIPVNRSGAALYMLLINGTNPEQIRYTLGRRPLRLDDMENLTVTLHYSDNTQVRAFPYSLENKAFYISGRSSGVYAVKLDPAKTLTKVTLGFHSYHVHMYLAAVSIGSRTPEFAALLDAPPEIQRPVSKPLAAPVKLALNGSRLQVNEFIFDLSDGFSTVRIPCGTVDTSSGIGVRMNNNFYTGRNFKVTDVSIKDQQAQIVLQGKAEYLPGVTLYLTIKPNTASGIIWQVRVANNTSKSMKLQVAPGALNKLRMAGGDAVCFPRFRTEVSSEPASYRAAYGQEFMHQFMDFFNSDANSGLMMWVDNRNNSKIEFIASLNSSGINGAIALQERYSEVPAGGSIDLSPVSWQPHAGDWHSALAIYRDFLDSFYDRGNDSARNYFFESMVNNCYHTTHTLSWRFYKVPPLLSKDKKTWYIDEVHEFEKQHLGRKLDFVHLWWSYNDAEDRFSYGQWASDKFYAQSGGLESFREAIRHYQEDLKIPVSLYTISDRVKNADVEGTGFDAEKMVKAYPNGALLLNESESYTCLCADAWVDFAVQDLAKLMRDTGAKIIYSDVVSSFNNSVCYSPKHGHPVPSNSTEGDLKFIYKLRQALPDDVAIWTEYGQPDTTSMYSDGFISYYFQELQEFFAPVGDRSDHRNSRFFEVPFASVRYLLPRYKLFVLPVGLEAGNKPSQADYAFFNGETFHEDTWFMHDSRIRHRLNRALAIKDEYKDCFLTMTPEPRVQTLAGGVYANRFPGKNRTLWTVYNATAMTVNKPLLAIDHQPGARYIDAWNGQELAPQIVDNKAIITLEIHPQQNGAVVQVLNK
ncbi:MAG: hypothetical protein E7047_00795 [Lentisphaerae bacterium]|nr:hypothetical protein [Lentisphaerota bacterium]